MKVLLIAGHGNGDSGALGNGYRECDLTREFVERLHNELCKYEDVETLVYDMNRNAYQDCVNGSYSIQQVDYVFEVHFNAYNGIAHGTECYVTTKEQGITVEQGIMSFLSKYFKLRDNDKVIDGVKAHDYYVIRKTKEKGISSALLEVCFIDNANDMKIYQENKNDIIDGVAQWLATGFGKNKLTVEVEEPEFLYQIGDKVRFSTCYSNASNAAHMISYIHSCFMNKDYGTITKQYKVDGKSVYLLDRNMCFVNDGDIREKL